MVNEDFLEGYLWNITFGETHDFTIGSEHRVCDAVLLNAQNQEVIFVRDGQYQSGPLLIPAEDMQRIFQQAKNIQ